MRRKLNNREKQDIIYMLAQGHESSIIQKAKNIDKRQVWKIRVEHAEEISEAKELIRKEAMKACIGNIQEVSQDIFKLMRDAYKHITVEKMEKTSAAQLTTMMAIMYDKYNMMINNGAQKIEVEFKNRDEAIGYLKGKSSESFENSEKEGKGLVR